MSVLINPYRFGAPAGAETAAWEAGIIALGGTVTLTERGYADALINAIQLSTFNSKIKYLLPFIGESVFAHRMPLRDSLGVGNAGAAGFVNADCTTAGGIDNVVGTAGKYLDTRIKASQLGVSNNGGMFVYIRELAFGTSVEPMGCYNIAGTDRFVMDLRSNLQAFRWGAPGNGASVATTASIGFYVGQRSSSTFREIYKDDVQLDTDVTNDATAGAGDKQMWAMGSNAAGGVPFRMRCAVLGFTDGTLTGAEVTNFRALLETHLITPTGR